MSGVFFLKNNDKMEQVQSEKIQLVVKNVNSNGILLQNAKGINLKGEDIKTTEYFLHVEEPDQNVDIQQAEFVAIENSEEAQDVDSQLVPLEMDDSGQIILQEKDVILWDELCRICANTSDKVVPIYSGEGLKHNLCKKIQNHLPINISEDDSLPLQVCYNCAETLLAWHEMTQNCLDAQQRLIELQNKLNSKNQEQNAVSEGEEEGITDNGTQMEAADNQEEEMQVETEEDNALETVQIINDSETDRAEQQQQQEKLKEVDKGGEENLTYMCGLCERLYQRETDLMIHMRSKHRAEAKNGPVRYECNTCNRGYLTKSRLVKHLRLHDREAHKKSGCQEEEQLIESCKSFDRQTHKLQYVCQLEDCRAVMKSRRGFIRHLRVHRDERPIVCEYCGKCYRIEDDLKRHIADVHHKIKRHPCDICGRSSTARSSAGSFKGFRKRRKPSVPANTRRNSTKARTKATNSRTSSRISKSKAKVSSEEVSKDDLLPIKKEEESDDDYFKIDIKYVESSEAKSPSSTPTAKRPRKKQKLASLKNFECKQCGKAFRQRKSYDIHMRQHTGEKPFTCHICGKQFGQTGSLYYHLKHLHGGVKNHACDICGRCFAMKTAMEDHRRIHTGERPYICDVCGKTFKTKASLYIHSKIHTDEYPFNCSYCKKPFRWKQQMISHLTTHTGEKNHICDICNKGFGVKNELTRHRRTHSTDKPFTCQKCGLSFGQKRYLTNHNRTRHKIKPTSAA